MATTADELVHIQADRPDQISLTIDGQDVANTGYFDDPGRDLELLPRRLRWNDLRAQGKSLSLGEYGVKTHPAWRQERGGSSCGRGRTA